MKDELNSCNRFAIVIGKKVEHWQHQIVQNMNDAGTSLQLVITIDNHKPARVFWDGRDAHVEVVGVEDVTIDLCERYHLSFILQFEACQLEHVVSALPFGVWTFRGHDGCVLNSHLAFKETLESQRTTSIYLTMNQGNDEEVVLKEGHVTTVLHSLKATKKEVYETITSWPPLLLNVLQKKPERTFKGYSIRPVRDSSPHPSVQERAQMVLKLGVRNVGRTFQRLFREEYWNVGIVNVPIETMLSEPVPSSVSWIPSSTTSYYADPFGLYEDEKVTVYMEEMKPYRVNGVVSRASYTREDPGVQYEEEAVLQQRNHLSYPYLFREYGDVYCVPETAGRNEVSLYRWCADSQCFAHEETLINNMKAIDSTLFYDGECWWLFCTVLKENRESHNSELHLFYSDQLKSGWKPHPLNPVKIDSRSSRSAGTPFHVDGTWYRPAQDCSVTYGGAVVFNKIITLTTEQYEEQVVTTITPCKESDFPDGIHTLSSVGPYTLLDGKCFRYHLFTPFRKWIQKTMAIYE